MHTLIYTTILLICFLFFEVLFHFRIGPAVLRQSTYGTIKFGTYYSLKSIIVEYNHGRESVTVNAICAVIAGAVSSAIANPTDVIKVRMQVAGINGGPNISLLNCFKDVYTQEGISGLWRVNYYFSFPIVGYNIFNIFNSHRKC